MPNWATNTVEIFASKEVLEQILAKGAEGHYEEWTDWNKDTHKHDTLTLHSNRFSFENFVPTPKNLTGDGNDGWYNWRVNNWGTKWDISQEDLQISEITATDEDGIFKVSLGFITAWSPANEFWTAFSKLYPTAVIEQKYWEEGIGFIGESTFENGEVADFCIDIDEDIYKQAGAEFIIDENGDKEVDWEVSEIEFSKVFPLV